MRIVVDLTPVDGMQAVPIADALLDFLCSMGEDPQALATLEAAVFSFDSIEPITERNRETP